MDVDVMCGWYAMAIGCILHTYVRGRVWVVIDRCLWRSTFPVYYATGESEIPSLHMLITPNVKGIIREGEERIVRVVTLGCFDCMIRQLVPVYNMHICLRHSPVAYVSEHIEFFFPRGELVFFPICTDATSYRQAYLAFISSFFSFGGWVAR